VSIPSRHPELDSGSINVVPQGEKSSLDRLCRAKQLSIVLREVNLGGCLSFNADKIETHPRPLPNYGGEKRAAFTLAEVLITLAIIGVVAAMTIPTLTANYKKKVVETRLSKFYSNMVQATTLSKIDNGEYSTWDRFQMQGIYDENDVHIGDTTVNTLEWYNKYLAPYLKTVKVEDKATSEGAVAVYFSDGSLLAMSGNSWLFYPNANDFKPFIDETSGLLVRDKKVSGVKYFTFGGVHRTKGFVGAYGDDLWDGTKEYLLNHPAIGCNKDATNERALCTKLIQINNWKIPDDYPLEF